MGFSFLFTVTAVLGLAAAAEKRCCTVDQWQSTGGIISGIVQDGEPKMIGGTASTSYDFTNKRVAMDNSIYVNEKMSQYKVIVDYKKGNAYMIEGQSCRVVNVPASMQKACVPEKATYNARFYMGAGEAKLYVDSWLLQKGNLYGTVAFSTEGCYLVSESESGTTAKGVPVVGTIGYINTTSGIHDPSIFNPPSSCKKTEYLSFSSSASRWLIEKMLSKFTSAPEPLEEIILDTML